MAPSSDRPGDVKATPTRAGARPNSLRQAASAVFAVTAIVPLLIFVWTLHHLGALSRFQAQLGLGLALAIALLGFYIFRRLMGRMSELIQALGNAVERGTRSVSEARGRPGVPGQAARPPADAHPPPVAPEAQRAGATRATQPPLGRAATPTAATAPAASPPAPEPPPPAPAVAAVPGLGMIQEVHDLSRAMAMLWMAEAVIHSGRRVVVSVMNTGRPVVGTLVELTHDGILIEQEGSGRVAVSYNRISAIDADQSSTAK